MNRRSFIKTSSLIACSTPLFHRVLAEDRVAGDLRDRVHGLLLGSMIGDALGGPVEFQERSSVQTLHNPPKIWGPDDVMDAASLKAAAGRLELKSYAALRPRPEPYAHWTVNAEPGSVTDDSRHKLILLQALHDADSEASWPLTVEGFARAHLEWPRNPDVTEHAGFKQLRIDWLREWEQGARWILGNRDLEIALPPARMWGGLPTCSGQMSLPPLAALFPGQPGPAYRAAYQLGFFDNGFGKDLNAALVAGLAVALMIPSTTVPDPAAWKTIMDAMRMTDPYQYQNVPWVTRPVDRWLDVARNAVNDAAGRPARMFATLEKEFQNTIKWEAQVPFVVAFACLEICQYHPLAALQLSIEWGHDTDSYAQMVGALIGALHGAGLFPAGLRVPVENRLQADYQIDLAAEAGFLAGLHASTAITELVQTR